MTTINIGVYKAVVVLNNIGITLLERQCYNEAQVTLKEAIDLMSCLRDETRLHMSQEKQSQFLNQAAKRIAKSTRALVDDADDDDNDINMSMDIDAIETTTSNVFLTVLSQHDTAHNTKEIVSACHPSCSSIVHRLEYIDETSINIATDTAILLHNFSMAIRVQLVPTDLSRYESSDKLALRTKLIDFAYQIARLADNVVNEHIEEMEMNCCCCYHQDHQQYIEALQISMLIAQNLMVLSSMMIPDQNRKILSQKYYHKLGHVRSMLLDTQDPSFDTLLLGFPAAQAA